MDGWMDGWLDGSIDRSIDRYIDRGARERIPIIWGEIEAANPQKQGYVHIIPKGTCHIPNTKLCIPKKKRRKGAFQEVRNTPQRSPAHIYI